MGTHALQIQSFDIKALKLWLCQSQIPFTGAATESLLPTQRQSPPATENDINVVGLGEVERIEALELSNISRLAVIDSLDEARTRVSGVSWTEFIESLDELARRGLRYVLLGRERTLEDVWAMLCDLSLSVAWWEISHFAPPQCIEYVDGRVLKRDPGTDCSTSEYKAARDALIASLRSAAEGTYAEAFVGYAPVLDAVAAMLIKRPNLLAIRQRFEEVGPRAEGRIKLLQDILEGLLERDQTKIKPLADELGIDPTLAYKPREQIRAPALFLSVWFGGGLLYAVGGEGVSAVV